MSWRYWKCPVGACQTLLTEPGIICDGCAAALHGYVRPVESSYLEDSADGREHSAVRVTFEGIVSAAQPPRAGTGPARDYADLAELDFRDVRNGLPVPRPYVYRGTGQDTLTGHLDDDELEMAS